MSSPRTWFITGFGRELVEQLLARGDRVAGTARKLAALDDLKAQYGERFWLASLEVTEPPSVHRVVDEAFAALEAQKDLACSTGFYPAE